MDQKTIETELRWFDALKEIMGEGLYVTNATGVVLMVNDTFTRITGISQNDIMGKNIQTYLDEQYTSGVYLRLDIKLGKDFDPGNEVSSARPDSLWKMVMGKGEEVSYASFVVNKGRKISVRFLGHPIYNDAGSIQYVMVTLQDLTQYDSLMGRLESLEDKNLKYLRELEYFRNSQKKNQNLIGESQAIQSLRELIDRVGRTDVNIMIYGETGVGKEIVAREIHESSKRTGKPYIKINCSAIPENLLESELFGYERGAFTGALNKTKIGYFEMANQGTLLLDEIGDMSYPLQAKLLRVLQDGEITRVGGTTIIKLDVRIIASTNRNLASMVREGLFREDLYYRLNVVPMWIPPLRDRVEDIPILSHVFLEQYNRKYQKNIALDSEALQLMCQYSWPGNVRELKSITERLVIINDSPHIERSLLNHLFGNVENKPVAIHEQEGDLKAMTHAFQKKIIESALKKYGSTYKAADALGMNQSSISRKARELKITSENFKE